MIAMCLGGAKSQQAMTILLFTMVLVETKGGIVRNASSEFSQPSISFRKIAPSDFLMFGELFCN